MPLTFDMPLDQLTAYRGTNPRPEDHDAYWEDALEDLAATDPQVAISAAAFTAPFAECSDLTFTGTGGARVYAKLLRPRGSDRPCPAVLRFHGYGSNSGDWFEHLAWVAAGFAVAALDCRGQGGRSEDVGGHRGPTQWGHIVRGLEGDPRNLLIRHLFLDTVRLATIVGGLENVDSRRISAMGKSQGGGLALACAALFPEIHRVVAVHPFLCDYRRVWDLDLAADAYAELQQFFRQFDPRHERADIIWSRLGYVDVQHLAPRIRSEVLLVVSLMDQVCPPSTQFAAYNKVTGPKHRLLYPDYGHEWMPDLSDRIYQFIADGSVQGATP